MAEKWIVLKFGGTSVAGKPQWETIASLAGERRTQGCRVLLVCSAVAGLTDLLTELANLPQSVPLKQKVLDLHIQLASDLDVADSAWLPEAKARLDECLSNLADQDLPRHRAELLATGEWLSTTIGTSYLQQHMDAGWVDAREAIEIVRESDLSPARQWLSASCRAGADAALTARWNTMPPVLVTQGFVARTEEGATALLGRGGSDTSAAIFAGRLDAHLLEIWTDVPGLFSTDPRVLDEARLLGEIDYTEALEMAASGAKVVHPRCIRAAAETSTPVIIRDVGRPHIEGTRIKTGKDTRSGIKAVICQRGMAVLLLQNLDARRQVGFLAGVFRVFAEAGVSVDLVATSETTTTVAINCAANHIDDEDLYRLSEALAPLCTVNLFPDCVCVNLVGHGARRALARLQPVMSWFEERPLLMASQSANDLCMSLLVRAGDHEDLLKAAHRALIPVVGQEDPGSTGVFGPTWADLVGGDD